MSTVTPPLLRSILLLLLVAAALPATAQITVTRADVATQLTTPQTATSFDATDGALAGLAALADRSGGGQTWDLTPFSWETRTVTTSAPASGSVPGSDIEGFGEATHVVAYTTGDSTAYAFVRLSDTAYDALGSTVVMDDGAGGTMAVGLRFAPFYTLMPLPLTAGSSWTTSYALEFVPAMEGITTETTEVSEVEGWGTLVTPAGSVPVLQVRTEIVTTSTVEFPGQPPFTSTDTTYTVAFVSKGGASATLLLDTDGTVTYASYSVFSDGAGTAGEGPTTGADLALSLRSANPVRRGGAVKVEFELAVPAGVRVEAFDALGRRVATLTEGTLGAGPQRAALATAGLPSGVYLVRLQAGDRTASLRVTVAE